MADERDARRVLPIPRLVLDDPNSHQSQQTAQPCEGSDEREVDVRPIDFGQQRDLSAHVQMCEPNRRVLRRYGRRCLISAVAPFPCGGYTVPAGAGSPFGPYTRSFLCPGYSSNPSSTTVFAVVVGALMLAIACSRSGSGVGQPVKKCC